MRRLHAMELLVLLALICSAAAQASWSSLTKMLTSIQDDANIPAMGLVLLNEGGVSFIDVRGDGIGIDSPFRWGSITKTFTALALLRLEEQGKVNLRDPARGYLPARAYDNPWSTQYPVRLLHLLELTAGFGDLSPAEFGIKRPLTMAEALAVDPTSRRVRWPPGLQHSYTNVAPGLTAAVIESVTGTTFETFTREQVLEPLGMRRSSFRPLPNLPGGFKADGTTPIPYWHMIFPAFGALNAPVRDMARFLTMLANDGRLDNHQVFSNHTIRGLHRARSGFAGKAGLPVSYGRGAYGWVSHGRVFFGHGGDADGYRSRYGLLDGTRRGYLIVINSDNLPALRKLQSAVERSLTADLDPPDTAARAALSPSELREYAGDYYPASSRFRIGRWARGEAPSAQVTVDGDHLLFQHGSRRVPLLPLGAGRFRRSTDPVATVVFARDAEGARYMQGEMGNYVMMKSEQCPRFIAHCHHP